MAQRIIVQDGNILYAASDEADWVNFTVAGQVSVTKVLNVGDDPTIDGVLSTPPGSGVDIIISTETDGVTNGNIRLEPVAGGSIVLNNTAWPDGTTTPNTGMFLGASGVNELQFYSFIFALNGSNSLTSSQLNSTYSAIQPGQVVLGPSVIYYFIGSGLWRLISATPIVGLFMNVINNENGEKDNRSSL